MAAIVHGQNRTTSPSLNGRTVAQARGDYGRVFNIPAGAQASINGTVVTDAAVIGPDDEVVFAVATGQKG